MLRYAAPLPDLRFVLHDLLEIGTEAGRPGFEHADRELLDAVLEGGARLCEEVLQPLNQAGDAEARRQARDLASLLTPVIKAHLSDMACENASLALQVFERDEAGAASMDYLRLMGTVLIGYTWARVALAARRRLDAGEGDAAFYEAKLHTGRFYMRRTMLETLTLAERVKAGADVLMAPADDSF